MPRIATKLGPVRPVHKGVYDPAKTYRLNNVVRYEGNAFWAVRDVPVNTPPGNEAYWELMAEAKPGPVGPQGGTGPQGPQGPTGPTGPQGPQGEQGPIGPKGDQGLPGAKGDKGDTGPQGPMGPVGEKGEQGPPGVDGTSFTIQALYPTLEALQAEHPQGMAGQAYAVGTDASNVIFIWDVDASAWVNVGALQGPQGPKGDTGDVGLQGPKGETGDTGPQGPQGQKGDTGDVGPQGLKGDKGDTGPQGTQGPKGETGATGAQGPKGDTGEPGTKGDKGDTGPQGPKGDKGETGAQGLKGDTGQQGPAGPGLPAGGTAGQIAVKQSGTNYDTAWKTLEAADIGAPTLKDGKVDTTYTTHPFVDIAASRTIQASDLGKFLRATAAITLTLPSTVLTDGFEFNVLQAGTGAVTVKAPSGVSINGVSAGSVTISEQYKVVGLKQYSATEWYAFGAP